MSLPVLWFVLITIVWAGFFVLEGFDFGVGMLHRFVGRDDLERRVAINAIGPVWDGNEVWLIVGGAAIFAAFPGWYATWFSAGYLAMTLLLVALIARGVSFELRGRRDSERWRATWSWSLTVGSTVAPLLIGVALGDLLAGLPVDAQQEFTGSFWDLLTPYGVFVGVVLLMLCLLHGATFLALRTEGPVRDRAHALASRLVWPAALLLVAFAIWTPVLSGASVIAGVVPPVLAVVAAVAAALSLRSRQDGRSFSLTAVAIGLTVASVFSNLYPSVLVSSTTAADSLTVDSTASGPYALKVMTVVALVLLPVVLAYQVWTYLVFRHRVSGVPLPTASTQGPIEDPPSPANEGATA